MNQFDNLPLVSIVTPVYNGSDYIEELILSIKLQNYSRIEHIIIDDGSQDGGDTVAILGNYPHLKWWSRTNRGQYATMNEGLEVAKGDVICFISADDLLCPGAIRAAVEYLKNHSNCDGVYGRTWIIQEDEGYERVQLIQEDGLDSHAQAPFSGWPFKLYPYFSHVSHCSLFIRTSALRTHSLFFNESYRYTGDYDWMIRMILAGLNIGFINKKLSIVWMHKNQATRKYRAQMLHEKDTVVEYYHLRNWKYYIFAFLYLLNVTYQKLRSSYQNIGRNGSFMLVSDWILRKTGKKR